MKPNAQMVRLGDVCKIEKIQGTHRGLPYVGLEHIESHSGQFVGSLEEKAARSATFRFTPKHVLYGRLRPYLNKVLVPDFGGHCSTEIFPLRPSVELDRGYLAYWLLSDETVDRINQTCTGARMPRANVDNIMEFEIPLPPLLDQQRIVRALGEGLEKVASAQVRAETNQANAKALFKSWLDELLSRGGAEWILVPFDQLATNLDHKRVPITKSDRESGKYPYYGASGIVDYVRDFIFEGDALLVSEDGANLLARSSPIAFSVAGKYWVNNHAHVLKFPNLATQRFVEFYLESLPLDPFITGAAQPKLTQKALGAIPIPIPREHSERKRLVAEFEEFSEEADKLASLYEAKGKALTELRSGLLRRAFMLDL